jgi:hypothetical protein
MTGRGPVESGRHQTRYDRCAGGLRDMQEGKLLTQRADLPVQTAKSYDLSSDLRPLPTSPDNCRNEASTPDVNPIRKAEPWPPPSTAVWACHDLCET